MALRSGVWEDRYGNLYWLQKELLHREDGPAIVQVNGTRIWYQNDQRHRLDGPAIECADGTCEWWIDGEEYTEEEYEHDRRVRKSEILLRKWGLKVDEL